MVVTPHAKCHIKGEITSNRAVIVAGIAALATLSVAASALGASGELRVEARANPDFLDPALAYDQLSWQVMAATQGGLLAFRRDSGTSGATLVPDLAEALPALSRDGRTLTFTLRDDVRFAPPVSRPATASDVKASLERIPNSYAELTEEQTDEILELIEKIEEDDDVQAVYHNLK